MQREKAASPSFDFFQKGVETIDSMTDREEAALKRWAVDYYTVQQANARNYLWVSFVIMSAVAAFYDSSDRFDFPWGEALYVVGCSLAISFAFGAVVFFCALRVLTGSSAHEPLRAFESDPLKGVELSDYQEAVVYDLKWMMHQAYRANLQATYDEVSRRAKTLNTAGAAAQVAVFFAILALVVYLWTY